MATIDIPRRHFAAKSSTLTAPSADELAAVADSIRPNELLLFIRALKRERARLRDASELSEAHLVLMRMCADRAVNEDVPGNVDRALGEFRWGR